MGTALIPTQGSCLPFTEILVFLPFKLIVSLGLRIEDVGLTAKEAIIFCPEDIPPRIPPALFDLNLFGLITFVYYNKCRELNLNF